MRSVLGPVAEPVAARFGRGVTTEAELRELVLATTDDDGRLDASPRGDPPGSVQVLADGRALAFADRKGNRRLDSLRNILRRPGVGMLFVVPGAHETLRVTGRATILRDGPLLQSMAARGDVPDLAVVVEVEELFVHCGRALRRSSFWDPGTWPDSAEVPSGTAMFRSQAEAGRR
jgi:PPOX class probable FMN-dependent enzyme